MNRALTILVATLALEAHTSERHDHLSLEALLSRSTLVAIVEPASPPTKKTELPIGPTGGKEKYPPYLRLQQRYVVKELLWSRDGRAPAAGTTLEVDQADFGMRRNVHERYHVEGVRKIPIYSYYQPAAEADAGSSDRTIVFLRRAGDGWEFAASGAIEPVSRRDQIAEQLAKREAQ